MGKKIERITEIVGVGKDAWVLYGIRVGIINRTDIACRLGAIPIIHDLQARGYPIVMEGVVNNAGKPNYKARVYIKK